MNRLLPVLGVVVLVPGIAGAASTLEATFDPQSESAVMIQETEQPEAFAEIILALRNDYAELLNVPAEKLELEAHVIPGPPSLETVTSDVIGDSRIRPDVVAQLPLTTAAPIASIVHVTARQKDMPAFMPTGHIYPTKRRLLSVDGEVITQSTVERELTIEVGERGMTVVGVCADAYAIVRLYEGKDDYLRDPESYLITLSEPCTTGTFQYVFSSVPAKMESGTYYLLAGDGDEYGEWMASSALSEIVVSNPLYGRNR